jgi:LmbE family N-acetylglucosaminyl deacetylase
MKNLLLELGRSPTPSVLCLGAHCDDIEIGCAAAVSKIARSVSNVHIDWVIFSSTEERRSESEKAAKRIAGAASNLNLHFFDFRDGFMPYAGSAPKDKLTDLSQEWSPDVVFTHYRDDAHQDHRLVSEITYNLFRNHLILEYEIPKYDGDIGRPNVFVPLTKEDGDAKVEILLDSFASQANKHWFTDETFRSLLRLRGIESGRENVYAEAFFCRKLGLLF